MCLTSDLWGRGECNPDQSQEQPQCDLIPPGGHTVRTALMILNHAGIFVLLSGLLVSHRTYNSSFMIFNRISVEFGLKASVRHAPR